MKTENSKMLAGILLVMAGVFIIKVSLHLPNNHSFAGPGVALLGIITFIGGFILFFRQLPDTDDLGPL